MKILNIKNYNQNFGYNKEYHEYVRTQLESKKQNKQFAKYLLEADQLSLRIEDDLCKMEKKVTSYHNPKYQDLWNYLIDLKSVIGFHMCAMFPKLNYSDNLIQQYLSEMQLAKDEVHAMWREKLAQSQIQYTDVEYPALAKTKKEKDKNDATLNSAKTIQEIIDQTVDNIKEKTTNQLLEKFKPTLSTPRGFEDIVGMDEIKQKLMEDIVEYAKDPLQAEIDFREYGIRAPRGFLFYGPPGCGKTFITSALAVESGLDMYRIDVSRVGSKYINQTSVNLQQAFDTLKEITSKNGKPVLLFLDEIDSMAMSRDNLSTSSPESAKTVNTLLTLIEQARDNNIIVIAATNRYNLLDEAFKARFDGQIFFPLPDEKQIKDLLTTLLNAREKGVKLASNQEAMMKFANMLNGYSNRSITFIVDSAAKKAKREKSEIKFEHLENAILTCELEKSEVKDYIGKKHKRLIGF